MKVFYNLYTLTPSKKANRLSSMERKSGVFLKGVLGDKVLFADYFPHLPLGDRTCEEFLSEFKFQDYLYDKKVFDLLLRDSELQTLKPKEFQNHQIWRDSEPLEASIVKYKLLHSEDLGFLRPLEKGVRLRIDANALFTKKEYENFLKAIPTDLYSLIDYVEDPLLDKDWQGLILPIARDFIEGTPFDYYIYKPNCEFKPKEDVKTIYSSYMGSDLGRWHAYCELVQNGDLSLTHGIVTLGFFEEEKNFFKGTYKEGFIADTNLVKNIYKDIAQSDWKLLCSM